MANLTIWEVKNRIKTLEEYHHLVRLYTEHSVYVNVQGSLPKDIIGVEAREKLNNLETKVSDYLLDCGNYPVITYRDPPAIGGRVTKIDAIENLFLLENFELPTIVVFDYLQKAIGYYQDDLTRALIRTINPFWWLWRMLAWLISLPFALLGWAGYDQGKIEKSAFGKLFKAITGIAIFIAALIAFLDSLVQLFINLGIYEFVLSWLNKFKLW